RNLQNTHRRYRIPRGTGRAPERAHQLPDRAFQDPREGSSLAPRPSEVGRSAATPAGLPEAQRYGSLRRADQAARYSEVAGAWLLASGPWHHRQVAGAVSPEPENQTS